jgi:hypothetical protein
MVPLRPRRRQHDHCNDNRRDIGSSGAIKAAKAMFVFYFHMGMGRIQWREEGDPINNRIKDRDYFYVRDIFSVPFCLVRVCT